MQKKYKKTELKVKKKEMKEVATMVEKILVDARNSHADFEEAINRIGLSDELVEEAVLALDKSRRKEVVKTLKKPEKQLEKQIKKANIKYENDTSFQVESVDENGRRVLRYVPEPGTLSFRDEIEKIERDLHRRRLSRKALLRDTEAFEARFMNHIEELQGHLREVHRQHRDLRVSTATTVSLGKAVYKPRQKTPPAPATDSRWIADNLEAIADKLSAGGAKLLKALVPFKKIMELARIAQIVLDHVENVARICLKAVVAAAAIPKVGAPFISVADVMGKIVPVLTAIDAKATLFMKTIGTFWDLSVGKVELVIASFDSGLVQYTAMGAGLVADVQESQCMRNLAKNLAGGVDILGGIEVRDCISIGLSGSKVQGSCHLVLYQVSF